MDPFQLDYGSLFEPVLLASAVLLGILTTVEDSKTGKISNKTLACFLAFAILWHIPLLAMGETAQIYAWSAIQNAILAFAAGLILWELKIWTAGDAKLFSTFAALIPLSIYQTGNLPYFQSASLLVNSFVPAAAGLAALSLAKTDFGEKQAVFRKSVNLSELFPFAIFAFAATYALGHLARGEMPAAPLILAILALAAFLKSQKPEVFSTLLAIALASATTLSAFAKDPLAPAPTAMASTAILILAIILMSFFSKLANFWFNGSTPISKIKPGMQALETVYLMNPGAAIKIESKTEIGKANGIIVPKTTKLTKGEAESLSKSINGGKALFETIVSIEHDGGVPSFKKTALIFFPSYAISAASAVLFGISPAEGLLYAAPMSLISAILAAKTTSAQAKKTIGANEIRAGIQTDEKIFIFEKAAHLNLPVKSAVPKNAGTPVLRLQNGAISKECLSKISLLRAEGKLDANSISIAQNIPMAPFIFAGFLTTVLIKSNVIYWLLSLLAK